MKREQQIIGNWIFLSISCWFRRIRLKIKEKFLVMKLGFGSLVVDTRKGKRHLLSDFFLSIFWKKPDEKLAFGRR